MRRSRRLIERLRVRGQNAQWQRKVDVIPRLPGTNKVRFGGDKNQVAKGRVRQFVRRTHTALASVRHPTLGSVRQTMMVHGARAAFGRARAYLPASRNSGPPDAGREQDENGKNGQNLA